MAIKAWPILFVIACGSEGAPGPEGSPGAAGAMGIKGDKGDPGEGGALLVYGDGSAGAVTVTASSQLLNGIGTDGNLQFTDFTVNAGVTLTVFNGTRLRCSGTFTNNGTIIVLGGAAGGSARGNVDNPSPVMRPAHPGLALQVSETGEIGDASQTRRGGFGAFGVSTISRDLELSASFGGGGGAATMVGVEGRTGGRGGGAFFVFAGGAIVNTGTITANGEVSTATLAVSRGGTGGGAGGLVILASRGSIDNAGTISVDGAVGGDALFDVGAGGGGGGGIIRLVAPVVTEGTLTAAGGAGGAAGTITRALRAGGSGGGGCGGSGGAGGNVDTANAAEAGQPGSSGVRSARLLDPTALL